MDVSDSLLCLFNARVDDRGDGDGFVIELPDRELDIGDVEDGQVYRVAILEQVADGGTTRPERTGRTERVPEPPLSEGETREVEIEDMGEQGDGIARVERGYIVFVPGVGIGDRPTIEITDVKENFAFGEVVDDGSDDRIGL